MTSFMEFMLSCGCCRCCPSHILRMEHRLLRQGIRGRGSGSNSSGKLMKAPEGSHHCKQRLAEEAGKGLCVHPAKALTLFYINIEELHHQVFGDSETRRRITWIMISYSTSDGRSTPKWFFNIYIHMTDNTSLQWPFFSAKPEQSINQGKLATV